ncbi:MAG: radical SAM domain-containing protein [Acidobacteria bacterium OLB17]|nr:MAG: radical SAM domain-containing protein [Acidobacteria bacterium OLB17]MCZ2392029.1 B12-binding domain-containing radical SAM protein [Acidobacteriota bacterium]
MKVLLVYPIFPDTYWSFRHALKIEGKRAPFPPLCLLTVAGMLPAAWERKLVDMNVEELRREDIEWADIVFVSAMIVQKESLEQVVDLVRSMGKRVAAGGPFVSTSSDKLPAADHIFIGEAENTLPEFLHDLELGIARKFYQADERPSLANTPTPDFSLIDMRHYSAMSLQYSRGCPFNCEFCDIIEIYGRVPRTKSNEQMLAELDALKAAGWRGMVFIVDDNFIGNKKNVRQLLPALLEWSRANGEPFTFITEASINLAEDEALLQLMQDVGFKRVFLGIETPVEESLKLANKGQNTKRNLLDSIRKIQSYGLEVMGGFIVGFDNDPEDIFERQMTFIRESGIPLAMVGLLSALPDTQLWRRLNKEGRLLNVTTGNNTDCSLNFIPKMDKDKLVAGYKRVLRNIYSPKEYYARALTCLARARKGKNAMLRRDLKDDLRSFIKLIVTLGIRDRARLHFWSYFYKLVLRHPRDLAHGLTLAAMGYHFRLITEKYTA